MSQQKLISNFRYKYVYKSYEDFRSKNMKPKHAIQTIDRSY